MRGGQLRADSVIVAIADNEAAAQRIVLDFVSDTDRDRTLILAVREVGPAGLVSIFERVRLLTPPTGVRWTTADAHRQAQHELSSYGSDVAAHWPEEHLPAPTDALRREWRRLAAPLWRPALAAGFLEVLAVLAGLLHPWPLKIAVDGITTGEWMWFEGAGSIAAAMAVVGSALIAFGALCEYGATLVSGRAGERATADLRKSMMRRLLRLPMPYYDRHSSGELLSRLDGDVERVQDGISRIITTTFPELATLIGMGVVLFWIDPLLACLALLAAPLLAWSVVHRRRRTHELQSKARSLEGRQQAAAVDLLRNARAVQGLGAELWAGRKYDDLTDQLADSTVESLEYQAKFSPLSDLVLSIISGAVLWVGVVRVSSGHLTVGTLLVVFSYLSGLYGPIRELARVGQTVSRTAASRERLSEVLLEPLPLERSRRFDEPVIGELTLDNVSFAYGDRQPVLTDVDLRIERGEHVCVVGPSGIGKTTTLHLIVRLYEPTNGRILLGNVPIRELPLAALRAAVALVPQDSWILDATLRDNLLLDSTTATTGQLEEVIDLCMLTGVVSRLPDGVDTRLGEGGARLSGGERRRVALARALLRGSPILLLDEPTSGLDAASETLIIETIKRVSMHRTILTVTHSAAVAAIADRVMRLQDGALIQERAKLTTLDSRRHRDVG